MPNYFLKWKSKPTHENGKSISKVSSLVDHFIHLLLCNVMIKIQEFSRTSDLKSFGHNESRET